MSIQASPFALNRSMLRVLIVDDVPRVRRELRTVLPLAGDIEIVGEAANGSEAIYLSESLQPDVIVMDLEMPVMDGVEATRQIKSKWPYCRVVILTIHDNKEEQKRAAQVGADFFLVKGAPIKDLVKAIVE